MSTTTVPKRGTELTLLRESESEEHSLIRYSSLVPSHIEWAAVCGRELNE